MADASAKRMMQQRQPERILSGAAYEDDARIDVAAAVVVFGDLDIERIVQNEERIDRIILIDLVHPVPAIGLLFYREYFPSIFLHAPIAFP